MSLTETLTHATVQASKATLKIKLIYCVDYMANCSVFTRMYKNFKNNHNLKVNALTLVVISM